MSEAIILLQEGVRMKMKHVDELFKAFEHCYPGYLRNHITIDHFCWDCGEVGEHDLFLASLWKTKSIDQVYTSLIEKNNSTRKVSVARICDDSFNCGFLEHHTLSKKKYFEISDQERDESQQEGIAHVEILWRASKENLLPFEESIIFNFFAQEGYTWRTITRGKYNYDIWEITDSHGFKIRFCREFLVNTIGDKELHFFL